MCVKQWFPLSWTAELKTICYQHFNRFRQYKGSWELSTLLIPCQLSMNNSSSLFSFSYHLIHAIDFISFHFIWYFIPKQCTLLSLYEEIQLALLFHCLPCFTGLNLYSNCVLIYTFYPKLLLPLLCFQTYIHLFLLEIVWFQTRGCIRSHLLFFVLARFASSS